MMPKNKKNRLVYEKDSSGGYSLSRTTKRWKCEVYRRVINQTKKRIVVVDRLNMIMYQKFVDLRHNQYSVAKFRHVHDMYRMEGITIKIEDI